MPLNSRTVRGLYKGIYAGITEKVTLLKRGPNFQASTITAYVLFTCRWSRLSKVGQQLDNEDTSSYRRTIHIPRTELDRVGVAYINALDQFQDKEGRFWQAESTTNITVKLFQQEIDVECFIINPTPNPVPGPTPHFE